MSITLDSSAWFIVVCIIVGLIYAAALYYRDKRFTNILKLVMAVSRFILVTAICFLLLSPASTFRDKDFEKPVVVWLQDNSTSVVSNPDSAIFKKTLAQDIQQFKEENPDVEVEIVPFDAELLEKNTPDYSGVNTNISKSLKKANTVFSNKHVSAFVLASDGIINQGYDPRFELGTIKKPIYSIVLGDTSKFVDSRIERVRHNKIAYQRNKFPVEIELFTEGVSRSNLELSIWHKNKKLASKKVSVSSDPYAEKHTFLVQAEEKGIQQFTVKLSGFEDEKYLRNNQYDVFIEIVESKKKVLIVSAITHPDVRAIQSALAGIEEYEVDIVKPEDVYENINPYHLVIYYQYPLKKGGYSNYFTSYKGNVLYIIGRNTNLQALNRFQDFFTYKMARSVEKVRPHLVTNTSSFTLSNEAIAFLEEVPPVATLLNKVEFHHTFESLLEARVMDVKTEYPLLSFAKLENRNVGLMNMEGLWRWRIYNYKDQENYDHFDELIRKIIRFTSSTEKLERFKITIPNKSSERKTVKVEAELYDQSYTFTNKGTVKLNVKNDKGELYEYELVSGLTNYNLELKGLPTGWYSYNAEALIADEIFKKEGRFFIEPVMIEQANLRANYSLMAQLARESGGDVYMHNEFGAFMNQFQETPKKPRLNTTIKTKEWIHIKWIFFLLLLLLAVEWFFRKWGGSY